MRPQGLDATDGVVLQRRHGGLAWVRAWQSTPCNFRQSVAGLSHKVPPHVRVEGRHSTQAIDGSRLAELSKLPDDDLLG